MGKVHRYKSGGDDREEGEKVRQGHLVLGDEEGEIRAKKPRWVRWGRQ